MKDSRKNYIIVGTFLLVLLGIGVVWIGMLVGVTNETHRYVMEFDNVMGLTEGAQILYEGYPVGEIEQIILTRGSKTSVYRLDVTIRKGFPIPKDSLAVITQAGFLSAVVIDIHEGQSQDLLSPGDRIPSQGATNILSTMAAVANQVGELADSSLKPLLDNLTGGTASLGTLAQDAPIILANLKAFTSHLNKTTHRLNTLIDQSGNHVDIILTDVEAASGNVSTLTTDFQQTSKRLDKLLVTMNTMVSKNKNEIDHSIGDLHHTLEVVASHIQEISYNLEATTRNLNELTSEVRQNPGVIIRGKEFREEREIVN
ncbi:MAG: MlaD family protein [Nitrospirales bacterium]